MLVVSDTSPLVALVHLGRLDLLQKIYREVLIPPAVMQELQRAPDSRVADAVGAAGFLRIVAPTQRLDDSTLPAGLGEGELEALALALENRADFLLLDESRGRRAGERLGLRITGTLGVLVAAKAIGLIDTVTPLIESLESGIQFRIGKRLRDSILRRAGE